MTFRAAILGRPNVGKSTLFNRLAGKRLALVDDTPGVTRDWREAPAHLGGLSFTVVDTAGLEEAFDESLEARMRRQTERALARADVVLLIVDARAGITPMDRHFANWLRKGRVPVVLVANKAEGRAGQAGMLEAFELGLGAPIPISAEHGEGMADLVEALLPFVPKEASEADGAGTDGASASGAPRGVPTAERVTDAELDAAEAAAAAEQDIVTEDPEAWRSRTLQLAIVGRPNVGKSTLLNALLGEERVLTGPEAGMTRDAITADLVWRDRPLQIVDTAGMRRRSRVENKLEKLAVADGLRAVRLANVVVLVVDADAILDRQDLAIARLVLDEGRGLVIAVNKWDIATDRKAALQTLKDKLEAQLPQARGIRWVTLSALRGQRLDALLEAVFDTYEIWNRRISTAKLNRWLKWVTDSHPPPLVEGRRIRLRYMTQIKTRPPTFAAWTTRPVELPETYVRYMVNGLRETFDLPGVPVRFYLRKTKNPFADET
ncbi:MAG TPA: ribosome biogenesis GTPase Der [Azospirillaceae bacterium]|nr:ribosome biogenesis GTPase Der [Azospirillaceae bacterium]